MTSIRKASTLSTPFRLLSTGHPTTKRVPGILIVSRRGGEELVRLADCTQFEVNEDDLKVKKKQERKQRLRATEVDFN